MKKNRICFLSFSFFMSLAALSACQNPNPVVEETKYNVSFNLNGGTGTAPVIEAQKEGAVFTIPSTDATKENYTFSGWNEGEEFYTVGSSFTMPARDVNFVAKWDKHISKPAFSKESYVYDRVAGGNLELPINLDGANFYYLDIDSKQVPFSKTKYDESKGCIVVDGEYMLNLTLGDHYVKAITDGDEEPAKCVLTITNSIQTTFDTTTKTFKKGYMDKVEFDADFSQTTISQVTTNDIVVDSSYYGYDNGKFYIKAEWLSKFYGSNTFSVLLSNNDKYNFTIDSSIVFYTDYDVTTIHDSSQSTVGHNPLYQYSTSESVQIVDGVDKMDGRVLKYVPNYEDVPLDCNGIYTLKSDVCSYLWYDAGLTKTKNYAVSFDYMTVNTTVGEFKFRAENNSWSDDLLLGTENDNKVHHYTRFIEGKDVGNGFFVRAFFKGGSGHVYFDNFTVTEIDSVPSISTISDYKYTGAITTTFDNANLLYDIKLDGKKYDGITTSGNTITIDEPTALALETGEHTLSLFTELGEVSTSFRSIKDLTCEFVTTEATYSSETGSGVRYYGNFGSELKIASVKQAEKTHDAGYGGWDFVVNNTTKDYKDQVTLQAGNNNEGYIEFSKELCESVFGTTQFIIEYTNGARSTLTLKNNYEMYSDYDNTSLLGYYNGSYSSGSPLNSGMWGSTQVNVSEYETGNNGLSITSTEGSADQCAFTTKYHDHVWDWYKINGESSKLYRTKFKYRITNLAQDSVYFYVMTPGSDKEAIANDFYGNYDQTDYVAGDNYYKVRYNLICDGQFHEFDSGLYTFDSSLRMSKIQLPSFAASDNAEVLIDNYCVESIDNTSPISTTQFYVDDPKDIQFTSNKEIERVLFNGSVVDFTKDGNKYTLASSLFTSLAYGDYTITLDYGTHMVKHTLTVTDLHVAVLTETSKHVTYQGGSVKLAGKFDTTLSVTSFKRQGTHDWDNTTGRLNGTSSDGTMDASYVTIEADGIRLSEEVVNQCYGEMSYTIEFSNKKKVQFTLTSNQIYYSDFNETLVFVEFAAGLNGPGCQDYTMATYETIESRRVLRYTPSNAVLGHALGADNRILTFSVEGKNGWWWQWNLGTLTSDSKLYIDLSYAISGDCDSYVFEYWDNSEQKHSVSLSKSNSSMSLELDANDVAAFGIGCSAYGTASAGSYMDIYSFAFGIK